jgi:hypothetical protein
LCCHPLCLSTSQQPWNQLEQKIYNMAAYKGLNINVFTGVCGSQGTMGTSGINVPQYYWKALCVKDPSTTKYMTIGFRGENTYSGAIVSGGTSTQWARAADVFTWRTANSAMAPSTCGTGISGPFSVNGVNTALLVECTKEANQNPDTTFWALLA